MGDQDLFATPANTVFWKAARDVRPDLSKRIQPMGTHIRARPTAQCHVKWKEECLNQSVIAWNPGTHLSKRHRRRIGMDNASFSGSGLCEYAYEQMENTQKTVRVCLRKQILHPIDKCPDTRSAGKCGLCGCRKNQITLGTQA